ncbi:hypothetical protein X801_04387 [Opisthorchis viverrini]|uniref:Uncharacterized protein n=2 Tax=Opisthorchis viverrini TaxID=6198 RepID=A0A1S8WZ67_OPIVI|nr:hypothetical protein T265_06904 [Opisthorchis viverrini]KER25667.1 hypothetical protein T265_06904 [Opisthorchis viverrini]OON19744.1 hypothetical protein X801_04387 [Opisthorchis viverrini]
MPYHKLIPTDVMPTTTSITEQIPSEDPPPYSVIDPNLQVPENVRPPGGPTPVTSLGCFNGAAVERSSEAPGSSLSTSTLPNTSACYGSTLPPVVITAEPVSYQEHEVAGRDPYVTYCPQCFQMVLTRTDPQAGELTFICFIFLLCFIGPFALLVCLFDTCKDVAHFCPTAQNWTIIHWTFIPAAHHTLIFLLLQYVFLSNTLS